MKAFFSIILIVLAGLAFFFYVDPKYDEIKLLQEEEARFDAALERSEELIALRDALLAKYNSFSSADLDRLESLLPDNVDNVRLILDLDGIAKKHGLSLQNVEVSQVGSSDDEGDGVGIGFLDVNLSVTSSYESFKLFLQDIEDSLRVMDVRTISFSASEGGGSTYALSMRTYWLD